MEKVNDQRQKTENKKTEDVHFSEAGEKLTSFSSPSIQRQRDLQETANTSEEVGKGARLQSIINSSEKVRRGATTQAMIDGSKHMQKAGANITGITQSPLVSIQRKRQDELFGAETRQLKTEDDRVLLQKKDKQSNEHATGMPGGLKNGVENLSGISMDDVKVHYNSQKPADISAHAYAQGTDIHVAPGQEKHLPHEAWHVVQQKQGRVKPTIQTKSDININDDEGLEKEADEMGQIALNNSSVIQEKAEHKEIATDSSRQPVQAKFNLTTSERVRLEAVEKDKAAAVEALFNALQEERHMLEYYEDEGSEGNVALVLDHDELKDKIEAMFDSDIDFGEIDVNNGQQLAFFYFRLQRELLTVKEDDNEDEEESEAKAKKEEDDRKWEAYENNVRLSINEMENRDGGNEDVYKLAILGSGASVADYIVNNFHSIDQENTIMIGKTQPWESERGSEGVINHPMNMIHPEYQGSELMDKEGGLAPRKDFSEELETIMNKITIRRNGAISSVTKTGKGVKYYCIGTEEGNVYAQNVVVGMGIGKHALPDDLEKSEEKRNNIARVENMIEGKIPRVMNMDEFQRYIIDGTLKPRVNFNSMVISGPNAAIDVATTAIRRGINPVHWIVGNSGPAFLPGTDNVYAERAYEEARGNNERLSNGITFLNYRYIGSNVGSTNVTVEYGVESDKKTITADIMVYGLGPDVRELKNMFKSEGEDKKVNPLSMEAIYDINQRFNFAQEDVKGGVISYLVGKLNFNEEKVIKALNDANSIVPIEKIVRDPKVQEKMFKTGVSKKLPGVTGVKASKEDENDESSLTVIGGTAYRLADKMKYTYVSGLYDDLVKNDYPGLQKSLDDLNMKKYPQRLVSQYMGNLHYYINEAFRRVDNLESLEKNVEEIAKKEELRKTGRVGGFSPQQMAEVKKEKGDRMLKGMLAKNPAELEHSFSYLNSFFGTIKNNIPRGAIDLITTNLGYLKNCHDMLMEYHEARKQMNGDENVTNHMLKVPKTLPQNILLSDQLTPIRSSVEAMSNAIPSNVEDGVNFVTSDSTVISAFIASACSDIPPALSDYLVARIVYDRRYLPLEEAPLPAPNDDNNPQSTFHIKKQNLFQNEWNRKIATINTLFNPEGLMDD